MPLKLSPVVQAAESSHGGNFSVFRLDRERLAGFIEPIMGFDHYRMSGPTFAPHPHAGFSAVSFVFEDSPGGLRNRDSLGNDLTIKPGEVLWTQAGSGVIHDEFPAERGQEVHGLQLFVNLRSRNKDLAPRMFHADAGNIAVLDDAAGNHVRILSGRLGSHRSPLDLAEPFDFLDARLRGSWTYPVNSRWNVMLYVLSGAIAITADGQTQRLAKGDAIGIRGEAGAGELRIDPVSPAHLLVLSGQDPQEPVAVYGPFIMNTQIELDEAYERYRAGRMGRLAPL